MLPPHETSLVVHDGALRRRWLWRIPRPRRRGRRDRGRLRRRAVPVRARLRARRHLPGRLLLGHLRVRRVPRRRGLRRDVTADLPGHLRRRQRVPRRLRLLAGRVSSRVHPRRRLWWGRNELRGRPVRRRRVLRRRGLRARPDLPRLRVRRAPARRRPLAADRRGLRRRRGVRERRLSPARARRDLLHRVHRRRGVLRLPDRARLHRLAGGAVAGRLRAAARRRARPGPRVRRGRRVPGAPLPGGAVHGGLRRRRRLPDRADVHHPPPGWHERHLLRLRLSGAHGRGADRRDRPRLGRAAGGHRRRARVRHPARHGQRDAAGAPRERGPARGRLLPGRRPREHHPVRRVRDPHAERPAHPLAPGRHRRIGGDARAEHHPRWR